MVSIYGAMTTERKSRIWELWRKGTPMSSIARDISKPPATVYSYLLYHGGISPRILLPTWSFTPAIRAAPGSEAPTKIRMACYASTSQKEQAWQTIRSASLMQLPPS